MEILYISPNRIQELQGICSDKLLIEVICKFAIKHKVIISNIEHPTNKEHPDGLWIIGSFLKDSGINRTNLIHVIIAFAYLGGFLQFREGETIFGDMNVLAELLRRNCITKNEYDYYVDIIYKARQNIKPLHFTLNNKKHTQ